MVANSRRVAAHAAERIAASSLVHNTSSLLLVRELTYPSIRPLSLGPMVGRPPIRSEWFLWLHDGMTAGSSQGPRRLLRSDRRQNRCTTPTFPVASIILHTGR